ncbi:hypothetical protein [Cryptosporangium phraense]|uniref:Uncharacterized protein n=1 Tax=Cryptosporangium phraense TaxID=2593070 RepID=A0A545ATJ0_9ACTN|nr:hypothetical protein [Cryptosporangium phraense]TQS44581.1 hypothetical protein FL583_14105 [Cryptosporangium phraense]
MTTPGPIIDEAAKFAEALLGRVGARDLPPELVERLSAAVADAAVAGAGLLRVVAEVATEWGKQAATPPDPEPPVQHIDID